MTRYRSLFRRTYIREASGKGCKNSFCLVDRSFLARSSSFSFLSFSFASILAFSLSFSFSLDFSPFSGGFVSVAIGPAAAASFALSFRLIL